MKSNAYYKDLKRFPSKRGRTYHHFHYGHLKHRLSIYWIDGIYLPQWFHVQIVHCILGGGSRAGTQRFGKFPNLAQRLYHWLCRIVFVVF